MKAKFVPLQASNLPKASAQFVPKVLENPSPDSDATTSTSPAMEPSTHARHGEPRIELKREGDQLTAITIHCTCGEVITLQCVY